MTHTPEKYGIQTVGSSGNDIRERGLITAAIVAMMAVLVVVVVRYGLVDEEW